MTHHHSTLMPMSEQKPIMMTLTLFRSPNDYLLLKPAPTAHHGGIDTGLGGSGALSDDGRL